MQYAISNLSIIPMRDKPDDKSEMVSQILFGEHFKVIEQRKKWSKVRTAYDNYEGWIDNKQYEIISKETYNTLEKSPIHTSGELVDFIFDKDQNLTTIPLGATLPNFENNQLSINDTTYIFEGKVRSGSEVLRENIIKTAFLYLNSPYLWGGKTPFGIDCSGFTQMVYKLCGSKLLRDASQQATQGEALSFIEESDPGDLAFFDNKDGKITHVGIIMKDNYIIHAHGKVRIDRLDHSGIYNVDLRKHTHKLRVIKKIL
ncbi:C40 family peptidase [Aureivirga sp. CE67]|uniref:C40 family peptidase n=1 Tax=Aureivirga sp. CE67 TaxID=1788983 RepID=UPI0018CA862F|nr:C40 family peptidase [Aureivirga sp. CE67]